MITKSLKKAIIPTPPTGDETLLLHDKSEVEKELILLHDITARYLHETFHFYVMTYLENLLV